MTALRCAARLAVVGLCIAGGCSATQNGVPNGNVVRSTTRVAPGQTGLEVVRWQVEDNGPRLEDALRAHAAPAAAGMDEKALRDNGFVIYPVKRAELDALLTDMGGSYMDVRTWFGQVTSWREIAATQVEPVMLEIDGIAHERPGAVARLMLRSWTLPMEDGTRIAVEMVPQVVVGEAESSLLRNSERLSGEVVTSCATELEMDRDVAWVITCDPSKQIDLKMPLQTAPPPEIPTGDAPTLPEERAPPIDAPQSETAPPIEQPMEPTPVVPPAEIPPSAAPPIQPAPTPPVPVAPAPAPPISPPLAPAPPPTGADRVPPPPPLLAPPAATPRPSKRPLPSAPPMQQPDPPTKPKLAVSLIPAMLLALPQTTEENPVATRSRVLSLGVQLLLASPEGAGLPSRRTVIVLVPHLDASPFPAPPGQAPINGSAAGR